MKKKSNILLALLLSFILPLTGCAAGSGSGENFREAAGHYTAPATETAAETAAEHETETVDLSSVPEYSGEPYIVINDNIPDFSEEDMTTDSFETYSELDALGRCGTAFADVGTDLMPTEKRESISQIKPSGWVNHEYDFVDGGYLYNRCHLIGFQLTGENANEQNLITGTRYLNVEGMLPFENMVADYVKETDQHVLYRVTPVYQEDDLVASGVQMEALSVEDGGEGIQFNVYCYNVQPGVEIDYETGENHAAEDQNTERDSEMDYILNTNSMKFHLPGCSGVSQMSAKNRQDYHGTREALIRQGYEPCSLCYP